MQDDVIEPTVGKVEVKDLLPRYKEKYQQVANYGPVRPDEYYQTITRHEPKGYPEYPRSPGLYVWQEPEEVIMVPDNNPDLDLPPERQYTPQRTVP